MAGEWSFDKQRRAREAAFAWVERRTHDGALPLHREEIINFEFEGEPLALMDRQRGIRKPRQFSSALAIMTSAGTKAGERPYADEVGADGLIRYKWRGDDPNHADNRALRASMQAKVPLLWFWGLGDSLYTAIFPIYLVAEEPHLHQFVVATDGGQTVPAPGSALEEATRRYVLAETKVRLHQPVFRGMVMRAYHQSCTICSLRHAELLDAAHIVPDRDERGIAAVRNGMAMCKIHHAAYDAHILGVTPDYRVEIREDILAETDGPMLEHGLKRLHGSALRVVPSVRSEKPDRALLDLAYQRFRNA